MKFIASLLLALTIQAQAKDATFNDFVQAINQVEASGKKVNVGYGDQGRALGPLQIHYAYWLEATMSDRTIGGSYEDCATYAYSVKVMTAYLKLYAKHSLQTANWEVCARIHNGGPRGHKTSATQGYWVKVKRSL